MSEDPRLISDVLLNEALNASSLPPSVKKLNLWTTDVYQSVDDLKSSRRSGEALQRGWSELKFYLDHAAERDC